MNLFAFFQLIFIFYNAFGQYDCYTSISLYHPDDPHYLTETLPILIKYPLDQYVKGIFEMKKNMFLCKGSIIRLKKGVTLDGRGHRIVSTDIDENHVGVLIYDAVEARLVNTTIVGFYYGVSIDRTDGVIIEDCNFEYSTQAGVIIGQRDYAINCLVRRTNFYENKRGLTGSGQQNTVYYCNFKDNWAENVRHTFIEHNTFDDGYCAGNFYDDVIGSPDPGGRRLTELWPGKYDTNLDGVPDMCPIRISSRSNNNFITFVFPLFMIFSLIIYG